MCVGRVAAPRTPTHASLDCVWMCQAVRLSLSRHQTLRPCRTALRLPGPIAMQRDDQTRRQIAKAVEILRNNGVNAESVFVSAATPLRPRRAPDLPFHARPPPPRAPAPVPGFHISSSRSRSSLGPPFSHAPGPPRTAAPQIPSFPLYSSFFWRRSIYLTRQQSAAIVNGLKAIGAIDKQGWLNYDPRTVSLPSCASPCCAVLCYESVPRPPACCCPVLSGAVLWPAARLCPRRMAAATRHALQNLPCWGATLWTGLRPTMAHALLLCARRRRFRCPHCAGAPCLPCCRSRSGRASCVRCCPGWATSTTSTTPTT